MQSGSPAVQESAGVQAYIRARQADVLARAITTLTDCPEPDLARQLHRLSGTLGTYQLAEARSALQDFDSIVKDPGVGPADIELARETALHRLGELAVTIEHTNEGESTQ